MRAAANGPILTDAGAGASRFDDRLKVTFDRSA